ncbi:hypothetical protein [Streptomyces sp. NBC_00038]|uniref:hypothetical protein n=1 Tax=Streptomyces sp. NBC_00038 TaxID=2903615 RepID=UPI0022516CED|nr:hypothetical protein [Streptomyces sp. NBC_00038]MCX5561531.1 hypothetical protein [Streptomyces sp. NBC_00038]
MLRTRTRHPRRTQGLGLLGGGFAIGRLTNSLDHADVHGAPDVGSVRAHRHHPWRPALVQRHRARPQSAERCPAAAEEASQGTVHVPTSPR